MSKFRIETIIDRLVRWVRKFVWVDEAGKYPWRMK